MNVVRFAILGLALGSSLIANHHPAAGPSKTVEIVAKRFEFQPSKITLKKGETVTLRVTSQDVTHGLFVRPLKIDADIAPGQTKEITITPENVGTFTAICDHFCGTGHGNMKMTFEVVE